MQNHIAKLNFLKPSCRYIDYTVSQTPIKMFSWFNLLFFCAEYQIKYAVYMKYECLNHFYTSENSIEFVIKRYAFFKREKDSTLCV